jgi:hypothetical protein
MSCDRSITSSMPISPDTAIQCSLIQFPASSIKSSGSYLSLLSRTPVISTFPPITCCRKQLLRKLWPIQLAFHHFIVGRTFLSSLTPTKHFFTYHMIGPTDCLLPSRARRVINSKNILIYFAKCPAILCYFKFKTIPSFQLISRSLHCKEYFI